MPELCSPLGFANAVYDGILKADLKEDWVFMEHIMDMYLTQPMRIQFTFNPTFNSDDFNGFIDWPQSSTYKQTHTIYFPYHSLMLGSDAYASIGYSDDTQSFEEYVHSRATQDELVWLMNNYFGVYGIDGVQ